MEAPVCGWELQNIPSFRTGRRDVKSQKTLYIRAASDIEDVAQELFADSFIGVYWTFPAVGRKELADGIGSAVLASYTIRRQREAILEVADQLGLKCRAECALQFQPQFGWDERIQRSFHEAMAMADPMAENGFRKPADVGRLLNKQGVKTACGERWSTQLAWHLRDLLFERRQQRRAARPSETPAAPRTTSTWKAPLSSEEIARRLSALGRVARSD